MVDWYVCPDDNSKMQFWNGTAWEPKYRPNPRSYRTFKVKHYSLLMTCLKVFVLLCWGIVVLFMASLSYGWGSYLFEPLVSFSLGEQRLIVLAAAGLAAVGHILRWFINQAEYPNGK